MNIADQMGNTAPKPGPPLDPMQRVQQQAEELATAVEALLARDVDGAEEAEVLERAQQLVSEALNG